MKDSEFLKNQTDAIVLHESTHYNQMVRYINKISSKCSGKNICGNKLYCFGVLFITAATSFDEFYSYMFNDEFGLYDMLKRSCIDVLIIASLDAKMDKCLDSLYEKEYIQTIVPHPTEDIDRICEALRLDNYIAKGDCVEEYVKIKSSSQFGMYKILNREGILNIIDENVTEEQIIEYLNWLKR